MHNIFLFFLKILAKVLGSSFHENFHMSKTLASLYDEGLSARASGFVMEDSDGSAVGIYIIRYDSNVSDNIDGRWN